MFQIRPYGPILVVKRPPMEAAAEARAAATAPTNSSSSSSSESKVLYEQRLVANAPN